MPLVAIGWIMQGWFSMISQPRLMLPGLLLSLGTLIEEAPKVVFKFSVKCFWMKER